LRAQICVCLVLNDIFAMIRESNWNERF